MSTSASPAVGTNSQSELQGTTQESAFKLWEFPSAPVRRAPVWLFACADVAIVLLNIALVIALKFNFYSTGSVRDLPLLDILPKFFVFAVFYAGAILIAFDAQDLYEIVQRRVSFDECIAVAKAILLTTILAACLVYFANAAIISRSAVAAIGTLNLVTLTSWRLCKRRVVARGILQGEYSRNVAVVGTGRTAQIFASYLMENPQFGYVFKGFIDKIPRASLPTLGPPEQMSSIIRSNFVDEVFVAVPADRELVEQVTKKARLDRFSVKIIPELYDGNGWHHVSYIGHFPCLALHREENPRFWMALKRVSDVIISLAGLIVLAPALLLLAILVRIDSRGSVLYVSQRVGKKGALFTCYKFRTMVNNAEELKSALHHLNERDGLLFKISKDPRVTRFGRFMRKYSLDELPQLWNVLRGDMSLVGPRPPLPAEVERYRTEHLRRLEVIPGITGLWQVTARRDPSFEHYVNLDLEYVENWSYALDLRIILRTIFVVLQGTGT